MVLKYNFHTHTSRCGHASGSDKEYVLEAIKNGFKEIGFADHVFLPGHPQPGTRGDYSQLDEYVSSLKKLQEKYKDKINIKIGFEAEYYPDMVDYYKDLLNSKKIDYLIIGQHCFINENNQFEWYLGQDNIHQRIQHYIKDLIEGMATGLFSYVAHPDFFVRLFHEVDPSIEQYSRQICDAAIKYDIPLEINLTGIRDRFTNINPFTYPSPYFWKVAGELGVKVVMGVDAHKPEEFAQSNYEYAFDLIKKYNLNFIEDYHS